MPASAASAHMHNSCSIDTVAIFYQTPATPRGQHWHREVRIIAHALLTKTFRPTPTAPGWMETNAGRPSTLESLDLYPGLPGQPRRTTDSPHH